jgi:transaldolase
MTKIFYDGCDIKKFATYPNVVGFTTNTTIMRQSNQLNYKTFYDAHQELIGERPISFQIFSDDPDVVKTQARQISSMGSNIYVKIPVINSKGESLLTTISDLLHENIKVNITAVFTQTQLDSIHDTLRLCQCGKNTACIVSVFGGRISDTGVVPKDIIQYAVTLFKALNWVEILWAGVKDNLILQQADDVSCHIVTLPDAIMSRINRIGQSLDNLSQDTVASFLKDAIDGKLTIL